MSAITDVPSFVPPADAPYMVNGARWMMRVAKMVAGVALVLATAGLWLTPGAFWEADLALFKMGMSLAFGIAGLSLIHAGRALRPVEIEIDTVRREVRLVRGKGRHRDLVKRTRFRDLGPAEVHGTMMRLWTPDGALLAEVAMTDPASRSSLVSALRDTGKL